MELTSKILAPYLPYHLRVKEGNNTYVLSGSLVDDIDNYPLLHHGIRPILRPLSELDKEITVNGRTFIPLTKHSGLTHNIGYCWKTIGSFPAFAQYTTMEKMFEWHFDVFGLIEAGLAIDINTINEQV